MPICLLAVCTLLAFSPVLGCDFAYFDDDEYVTQNAHVRAGLTAEGFRWAWTTDHAANWHPLTWLSLMLDAQLFGTGPRGFHLTNLLWHTANVLLLFVVLRSLTGAVWRSALVAALFALHPLHVESVAWVSEHKDVLSTFFGLLALLAYARYAAAPSVLRYLAVLVCMALSLLAKPMWVTLPFVLLLLDYWPLRRWRPAGQPAPADNGPIFAPASLRRLVLEKLPLLALSVLLSVVTFVVQQRGAAVRTLEEAALPTRFANAVVSYGMYLWQTLRPVDLAAFYPFPTGGVSAMPLAVAGLVLAAVTVVAVREARRRPYLVVGWLWYVGILVPVIGLVQVGDQARADRYTYVPLIGIFVMLAWGLAECARRWQAERGVAVAVVGALVGLGLATWVQANYWTNNQMLWEHALEVAGPSWPAHNGLGLAMKDRGKLEDAQKHFLAAIHLTPREWRSQLNMGLVLTQDGKPHEAIRYLADAVRLNPAGSEGHTALGLALQEIGDLQKAIPELEEARRLDPGSAKVQANLGLALIQSGQPDRAVAPLHDAVRLDPGFASAQYLLALSAQLREDWPEAEAAYRRAIDLEPRDSRARRGLAYVLAKQGRAADAGVLYQESLKLDRSWPTATLRTVWVLAADPDVRKRQGRLAVQEAEKAVQALGGAEPAALDALAAAYAEAGRFTDAVSTARRGAAAADASGKTDLARAIRERLRLYEMGTPFRVPPS
jgi:tetratricopeptide (TPR) repeat protein